MPRFGEKSRRQLDSCHKDLQLVCEVAIKLIDFSVLEGHRGRDRQERMVEEGKSKLEWPKSRHNDLPSRAVDLAPYPIDFSNRDKAIARFYLLAGVVLKTADMLGIKLRWGGDWDGDWDLFDQEFDDLGHFEMVEVV